MSREQDTSCDTVRATVAKVQDDYVVAYPLADCGDLTRNDSVTFSLSEWQGRTEPQSGQIVELIDTALYRRGWRAFGARPVTPQSSSQQNKQKARRA